MTELELKKIIEQHRLVIQNLVALFAERFKDRHERLFKKLELNGEEIFPLPIKEGPFVELKDDLINTYIEDLSDRIQIALNIKQEEYEGDKAEYEIEHAECVRKGDTLILKLRLADEDEDED